MSDQDLQSAHAAMIGSAFEHSDHAVFVSAESDGRYLAVNDAGCRLLGYSRSELLELTAAHVAGDRATGQTPDTALADGAARLRRADGMVIEIGCAEARTSLGGSGARITMTTPVRTARVLDRARNARARSRGLVREADALQADACQQIRRTEALRAAADHPALDERDLEAVRAALTARLVSSWKRFDEAASELVCLHEVPVEQLMFAVRRAAVAAAESDESTERD